MRTVVYCGGCVRVVKEGGRVTVEGKRKGGCMRGVVDCGVVILKDSRLVASPSRTSTSRQS